MENQQLLTNDQFNQQVNDFNQLNKNDQKGVQNGLSNKYSKQVLQVWDYLVRVKKAFPNDPFPIPAFLAVKMCGYNPSKYFYLYEDHLKTKGEENIDWILKSKEEVFRSKNKDLNGDRQGGSKVASQYIEITYDVPGRENETISMNTKNKKFPFVTVNFARTLLQNSQNAKFSIAKELNSLLWTASEFINDVLHSIQRKRKHSSTLEHCEKRIRLADQFNDHKQLHKDLQLSPNLLQFILRLFNTAITGCPKSDIADIVEKLPESFKFRDYFTPEMVSHYNTMIGLYGKQLKENREKYMRNDAAVKECAISICESSALLCKMFFHNKLPVLNGNKKPQLSLEQAREIVYEEAKSKLRLDNQVHLLKQ